MDCDQDTDRVAIGPGYSLWLGAGIGASGLLDSSISPFADDHEYQRAWSWPTNKWTVSVHWGGQRAVVLDNDTVHFPSINGQICGVASGIAVSL